MKPATTMENPPTEIAVSLSQHDPLVSVKKAAAFITSTLPIRSASMRDMGTEMSPIPSQEPSQTGSPARETSPPTSSRPSTSGRTVLASTVQLQTAPAACRDDLNKTESDEEMLKKTCREIMILGWQLDNENIAACASKKEETDASISLKTIPQNQSMRSVIEARAAAWVEAEQSKYLARFKREEIKIYAWKNHQKAKIVAEMKKIEVEVERTRAHELERLMNKVAAASHKAEKMRATAQAKRNYQAATTAKQPEYIRRTGRIPSSFFYWRCCFKSSSLLKYDVF
ncbi:Remorin, C-terminal region [Musa troglodytarum]|uniref:Remorin, C-terminal region n=1 Tax=Musa troglodytarum TaxID=320322 RepID=A0A9E7FVC9_9LILI|nr:Remorin, C-terminal region [Musa troglodytarum]